MITKTKKKRACPMGQALFVDAFLRIPSG